MRPVDLAFYRAPPAIRWVLRLIWHIEHGFERARAEGHALDDARRRIRFVFLMFSAGFVVLAVCASKAALFPSVERVTALAAPDGARADIVDRNGQLLAVDLPHYGVYFNPAENWDTGEVLRKLPAVLPQLNAERLDRALHATRRQYLIGGLTPEEKAKVDDLGLPGISFENEVGRVYPQGSTAGHLIGFVDRGGSGLAGAELGLNQAIDDDAGKTALPLSIDVRVQAAVQDELSKAAEKFNAIGGVGIVTNVHTGEILAMASWPNFDPNKAGESPPADMINHAAATVYEPGSVFKVFTLAMGIDAGLANVDTPFDVATPLQLAGGRVIHDYHKGDSVLPLSKVFTHSSNIGAARLGLMAGSERMDKYFRSFGLFAAAPSELKESARPLVQKRLDENTVASMSFGEAIAVSPLAIATGMNAIVNGGQYVPLTIKKLEPGQVPQGHRVISEATSRTMLDLMRLNVTSEDGSGKKADVPGYSVGGKTGSAEKSAGGGIARKKLVSSFAAVFPTDGPMNADRYFILIMLDEPKATKDTFGFATGGWTAAPSVGRIVERIAPYVGVKREPIDMATLYGGKGKPTELQGSGR
ncbi:peptidoglycan D,D-transpeptidase FtsI family protein [Phenylobacterium montanum]|uniref:Penicillin-binding protein 2 n=1 Tax=Phenylobacterium montanum TaxID=2823693 RepID=A0A975FYY0_9CAUL|nr:penicillin-binding protein 2 [Caulobacter sp. S6]QUD87741.1 penicillin-binding protein 2 [Caulobacter sp. S6]